MRLLLVRVATNDDCTPGVLLTEDGNPFCLTFEEGWRDNKKGMSCIPPGIYQVVRTKTPKHGETFIITHVSNRDAILIHSGNTEKDTEGCILLGMEFGFLQTKDDQSQEVERQPAVLRSSEAFKKFMLLTADVNEFTLDIRWCAEVR
jgi:hypothetical protein